MILLGLSSLVKKMSAEPMIRELFRSLESTLHERLSLVEQILVTIEKPKVPLYDHEFVKRIERLERASHAPDTSFLESRISALEEQLVSTCAELESLKSQMAQGRPAGPSQLTAQVEEAVELEEEVEVEETQEEPQEEPQEEGLELEELEYRGVTYYKDAENNVYGTDEEGAVIPEPIARWNGTKLVRLG
jgi:hypothetical protein